MILLLVLATPLANHLTNHYVKSLVVSCSIFRRFPLNAANILKNDSDSSNEIFSNKFTLCKKFSKNIWLACCPKNFGQGCSFIYFILYTFIQWILNPVLLTGQCETSCGDAIIDMCY